ncbi:hypothetical protein ACRE_037190 [Hapsidospora chrysogenum ATCC 11550]|uniref:Uncharacterized protein n=1 Tax=Hapsidospora chrysogenum (strain ATCC 11550 / CBS 779.69 / DSM 880 / IAM 14645 / JCM 23072 / IMI 49137) TaxID=857340 RepID=A0A086T826_HAPC1|nr:hypothetical protein ACRE_037190 [Hapsidospora chrysogenum ATCC 11550]
MVLVGGIHKKRRNLWQSDRKTSSACVGAKTHRGQMEQLEVAHRGPMVVVLLRRNLPKRSIR